MATTRTHLSTRKAARKRRLAGAVTVEYLVMLLILAGVGAACAGLGYVLYENTVRADTILRANSP